MYLRREVILATFAFVGSRPAGSGLTFDYLTPPSRLPLRGRLLFEFIALSLRILGEPWRTWFEPADLAAELRRTGFARIEDLDWSGLPRLGGLGAVRAVSATM